ncbi:hypothetical protein V757_11680 [Pelistega indica]|uniref:Uncharacterized protein n=1 Tax=Pelistega indica TaxID=1414851 RepID=V8FTV2_9BURK|nr:hypothetical protein [Pelistega indica]ETD67133.1 hypothetical protein V757_11680 [Pelistega indica]
MKLLFVTVMTAFCLTGCFSSQTYYPSLGCWSVSKFLWPIQYQYYKCNDGSEIHDGVRTYPDKKKENIPVTEPKITKPTVKKKMRKKK